MPATRPEDLHRMFGRAADAADVEEALDLYEPDPAFAGQPGDQARGTDALRDHLKGFFAMKPTFTRFETTKVFEANGVALLCSEWTVRAQGENGEPVELGGRGTEVARQQPDATWRFVIDNPWGTD